MVCGGGVVVWWGSSLTHTLGEGHSNNSAGRGIESILHGERERGKERERERERGEASVWLQGMGGVRMDVAWMLLI